MKTTIYREPIQIESVFSMLPQTILSQIFYILRMPLFVSSWYYLGTAGSEDPTFIGITSGWAIALFIQFLYGLIRSTCFTKIEDITYASSALSEVSSYCFVACFLIKFTRGGSSDTDPRLLASISFTVIPIILIIFISCTTICCVVHTVQKRSNALYQQIKPLASATPDPPPADPKAIMNTLKV
jgi:hypothetical protein